MVPSGMQLLAEIESGEFSVASATSSERVWVVTFSTDDGPANNYIFNRSTESSEFSLNPKMTQDLGFSLNLNLRPQALPLHATPSRGSSGEGLGLVLPLSPIPYTLILSISVAATSCGALGVACVRSSAANAFFHR